MSVYAPVPAYADRKRHPATLLFIIGVHAALLAAVMSAKMDLANPFNPTRTDVTLVPLPAEPPKDQPKPREKPRQSVIDRVPSVVPLPQPDLPRVVRVPVPLPFPDTGAVVGPGSGIV